MYSAGNVNDPCDSPSILNKLKLKNINRLVIGHLNMNTLPSKFDQSKLIIEKILTFQSLQKPKLFPVSLIFSL